MRALMRKPTNALATSTHVADGVLVRCRREGACNAGMRNVSAERPSAAAHGARSHGTLLPRAHEDAGSEGDDFERDDSSEFERFDAAAQSALDERRGGGLGDEPSGLDAVLNEDGDSGDDDGEALTDDDDDF